jgi:hypothetical protein
MNADNDTVVMLVVMGLWPAFKRLPAREASDDEVIYTLPCVVMKHWCSQWLAFRSPLLPMLISC